MITAEEFIALKNKIKAEMARRNGYGSLSGFTSSNYDFNVIPEQGGIVLAEQGAKVVDLALQIEDIDGLAFIQRGDLKPSNLMDIDVKLDGWQAEQMESENTSSCRGACTGLCDTTCTTGCRKGCIGSCSGCGSSCSATCGNGCDQTCGVSCGNKCSNTCKGGCGDGCSGCKGTNK